jgi:hypothetical protein
MRLLERLIGGSDAGRSADVSTPPSQSPEPGGGVRLDLPWPLRYPDEGLIQTRTDPRLQVDTLTQIKFQVGFLSARRPMPSTDGAYVASIVQTEVSSWPGESLVKPGVPAGMPGCPGTWCERWTVDCGVTLLSFAVEFAPDPNGGTNLKVALID